MFWTESSIPKQLQFLSAFVIHESTNLVANEGLRIHKVMVKYCKNVNSWKHYC
jgi:hypothetical protein